MRPSDPKPSYCTPARMTTSTDTDIAPGAGTPRRPRSSRLPVAGVGQGNGRMAARQAFLRCGTTSSRPVPFLVVRCLRCLRGLEVQLRGLRNTSLNPESRNLLRVEIPDRPAGDNFIGNLMEKDPGERRLLIRSGSCPGSGRAGCVGARIGRPLSPSPSSRSMLGVWHAPT